MQSPLAKLSFLIVDDNANMSAIVKTILKTFGAVHIWEARDVGEAFGIVRQYATDIIILDYNLGFMDGIDFVRLMRTATDSPNPYIPIIMLTAHTELSTVQAARDAGTDEFCAKPIAPMALYRKIATVIEHTRPYVRASDFFGPDRRRRQDGIGPDGGGDRRRAGRVSKI